MHFYLKKKQRKSYFRKVLENSRVDFFFEIYNKFVKFLTDLVNISITLKILIHEN